MAIYPVSSGDDQAIIDAINYSISGPSGLGQQLKGFKSPADEAQGFPTRITGNYRLPYTDNNFVAGVGYTANLYVAPIPLSTSEWLDDLTWKFTYATPQAYPPFALGNNITIDGVTPSDYDDTFSRVGVVKSTTTYVICRASGPYPNPGVVGTGGTASLWVTSPASNEDRPDATMSTDANAIISVDGGNSLVSVTGQLEISDYSYAVFTAPPSFGARTKIAVALNRYKAFNSGTAANPQYFYEFDATVASQIIADFYSPNATQGIPTSFTMVSGTSSPSAAYTNVLPGQVETLTGSGNYVGGIFDITTPGSAYTVDATFTPSDGGNYAVGDQCKIKGDILGGTTPANDLIMEVASVDNTGDVVVDTPTTVIFTPVIDTPGSGLYWYIIEIVIFNIGEVAFKYMTLGRRNLTAQVIKK